MMKEAQSLNDEEVMLRSFTISSFVIPSCFGIRHSALRQRDSSTEPVLSEVKGSE